MQRIGEVQEEDMLDVVRLYHLPALVAWICDIVLAIFYVAYIEKQVFLAQVRQV